jgi:hypothetical protein
MPSRTLSNGIANWFYDLRELQAACNSTAASAMNLLQFADANIVAVLPTATEQSTFLTSAANSTGIDDISTADLTNFKTFEGLLDFWRPLITPIGILLQSLAAPALQGIASADLMNALVSDAFPGGSKAASWTSALNSLASSIPAICFTAKFQTTINAAVDKAGTKMSDLIAMIAVLG